MIGERWSWVRLDESAMVARTIGMVFSTIEGKCGMRALAEVSRGAIREVRTPVEEAREQTRAHALHLLTVFACRVDHTNAASVRSGHAATVLIYHARPPGIDLHPATEPPCGACMSLPLVDLQR
jgi:hypothetical protein